MQITAVVLAAGLGARMGALTQNKSKAMVQVSGETLISRILQQCLDSGVNEALVVIGHMADELVDYVKTLDLSIKVHFVRNEQFQSTNNIYSLKLALDDLRDRSYKGNLLLIECDLYLESTVLHRFLEDEKPTMAMVSKYRQGMDGTVVRVSDKDQLLITDIVSQKRQNIDFNYRDVYKTVNIYKFSHSYWNTKLHPILNWYVSNVDDSSYYEYAISLLAMVDEELFAWVVDPSEWSEIDDRNDLRIAEIKFSNEKMYQEINNSYGGFWDFDIVDFCYLRNMHFPTAEMYAHLGNFLPEALQNYGSSQSVLNEKLSWLLETDSESLIALDGLTAVYPALADIFPESHFLIPNPTFGEYHERFEYVEMYDSDISMVDLSNMISKSKPDVVVIVNPNNPTGHLFKSSEILSLVNTNSQVMFLIDESFHRFTEEVSFMYLECPKNAIVLSSMSKDYGLPGLRLGFAFSHNRDLLLEISNRLPIWSMSSLAEFFITLCLKYRSAFKNSLRLTREEKSDFEDCLKAINGLNVVEEVFGNFVLIEFIEFPADFSTAIVEKLLDKGFYVKDLTIKLQAKSPTFRFAVRLKEENDKLMLAIKEVLGH